jgi:hypothetical protein
VRVAFWSLDAAGAPAHCGRDNNRGCRFLGSPCQLINSCVAPQCGHIDYSNNGAGTERQGGVETALPGMQQQHMSSRAQAQQQQKQATDPARAAIGMVFG